MVTNRISLYKTIGTNLIGENGANIKVQPPTLSYQSLVDDEVKMITIPKENSDIKINEFDYDWVPEQNNLIYKQTFSIEHPDLLFGEEGVTGKNNIIGLAVHIFSKEAKFQKTIPIESIYNDARRKEMFFEHTFNAGTLRGTIIFEFFFYLKDILQDDTQDFFQADSIGAILSEGPIAEKRIFVDGEGSMFPIGNFSEKGGPLWTIEKRWADPISDSFDATNLILKLNTEHPLFPALLKDKGKANKMLMGGILINAMSMIIDQVLNKEEISLGKIDEYEEGTIIATIAYWVDIFDIKDTTDIFSIQNALNRNAESSFGEGETN